MKMNEALINQAAIKSIENLIETFYDFCGEGEGDNNLRLVTLGEINGVINLVDELKKGLKND